MNWLLKCQNEDGGFGESTKSYFERSWAGKGKSTPSQTAWALMALIEYYYCDAKFKGNTFFLVLDFNLNQKNKMKSNILDAVERAIEYLKTNFDGERTWTDASGVGTGHRKIIFMQYPVYAITWPLIALARYSNLKNKSQ